MNKSTELFSLRRIPVNSGDDSRLFAWKLRGGYDWLYGVQALTKKVRRLKVTN